MSSKELRRAGVLARVESGELKLVDAAVLMGMSYRQSKRLAKRYREGGTQGLKHGSAGRESNRSPSSPEYFLPTNRITRSRNFFGFLRFDSRPALPCFSPCAPPSR